MSTDSETLVLVGDPELEPDEIRHLRDLRTAGATIVAWQHGRIVQDRFPSPDVAAELRRLEIDCATPAELLDADFDIEESVIDWMKQFGKGFRNRFRYGPMVLWWWAELYLYHETPLRLAVRDVEVLARIVEARKPKRIVVVRPVRALETAARHFVGDVEVAGAAVVGPPSAAKTTVLHTVDFIKMLGTGLKSVFRRPPSSEAGSPRVFFLTHGSMWRGGREMYFDRILPAVGERALPIVVAFGPPIPFKQRGPVSAVKDLLEIGESTLPYRPIRRYLSFGMSLDLAGAFSQCRKMWREFRTSTEIAHRGVSLGAEAMACFRDMFFRQLPWAIRAYREVRSVLEREKPDVMVLYAESSGLGRAAVTAAREAGVPSFAVQHGIMYPHYYSHEHRSFELEGSGGVPIPTRTAVFGSMARDILVERGSYPEDRIVITGSPKFDALVRATEGFDAEATCRELGLPTGARGLVLASRWTAVGPVFPELVEAVERFEGVFLYVKPHQAESTKPYDEVLARLAPDRAKMLPASANLLELLFATDGLITVDSFASSEALVLGRPVLVVNQPGNLDALVDRGVALGVRRGEPIEAALRQFVFDEAAARELARKREDYIQEFAFGADGRSTERIVEAILETCKR